MRSSLIKSTPLVLAFMVVTTGCVKLKDKNEDQAPTVVRSFEVQNLTVDQPLYLVNGQFLRKEEVASTEEQNSQKSLGDRVEYELHFEHLYFKEGGVLYTMGQVVRLYVDDLDSRGGKIISLPEGIVAPLMAEGQSGGSVTLKIQRARGDLLLLMTGGQGGPGISGAQGVDGNDSDEIRTIYNRLGGFLMCHVGGRGGSGSQGAQGGSSGIAEIELSDDSNFNLKIIRQAGIGGVGGEGGDGGISRGGYACDYSSFRKGERGSRGPQGVDGLVQEACIRKGSGPRQCM